MIAIERILCPIDGSEFSRQALRHAVALARWYRATVTVLSVRQVLPAPALWSEYPGPFPHERPWPRDEAERAARAFVDSVPGAPGVEIELAEGAVVPEILRAAADRRADLIVMGTHGLTGFDRVLLGSVTEKVLRKAPCPVLTVPRALTEGHQQPDIAFKTIVCGIDFSGASSRGLDYALSLAQEAGGRIVLVHSLEWGADGELHASVHESIAEARRTLDQWAQNQLAALVPADARTWCDPETVVAHGKAYREILRVAQERLADLVVLGVQGRNPVDLALFGSTAQHVLRESTCPVLTVNATARSTATA